MRLICAIVALLLTPLGVDSAYADSDGYYCVGRGYLAYQFGFAAPPVGPHRLFVIRFGGASGIESPAVLDLPQFQVGGMLCGDRTVQLADAIYTIQLDATNRPVRYDSSPWLDRGHTPPQFVGHSENLGAFNPAARTLKLRRISLGPVNGGGQYLLEMNANAISSDMRVRWRPACTMNAPWPKAP